MPNITTIAAILSCLLLAEFVDYPPTRSMSVSLLTMLVLVGIVAILFKWRVTKVCSKSEFQDSCATERFVKLRKRFLSVWSLSYPVMLFSTGLLAWCAIAKNEPGMRLFFLGSMFGPHLCFCVLLEWVSAQFDATHSQEVWSRWWLRVRLGELSGIVVCLVPTAIVSFGFDAWSLLAPLALPLGTQLALSALLFLTISLLHPVMFAKWTGVRRLENEQCLMRITQLLNRNGIRGCRVYEVPSEGHWCSAAVVGAIPWTRQLWIGDALIDRLHPRELDLVVLHEVAHIKKNHFLFRLLPLVWSAIAGGMITLALYSVGVPVSYAGTIAIAPAAGCMLFGMGVVSRAAELEADSYACDLAQASCSWCETEADSRLELVSALRKITPETSKNRTSWLHPSFYERIRGLAKSSALSRPNRQHDSLQVAAAVEA